MFERAFGQLAPHGYESKPEAHDKEARGERRHGAVLTAPRNDPHTQTLDVPCRVSILVLFFLPQWSRI